MWARAPPPMAALQLQLYWSAPFQKFHRSGWAGGTLNELICFTTKPQYSHYFANQPTNNKASFTQFKVFPKKKKKTACVELEIKSITIAIEQITEGLLVSAILQRSYLELLLFFHQLQTVPLLISYSSKNKIYIRLRKTKKNRNWSEIRHYLERIEYLWEPRDTIFQARAWIGGRRRRDIDSGSDERVVRELEPELTHELSAPQGVHYPQPG